MRLRANPSRGLFAAGVSLLAGVLLLASPSPPRETPPAGFREPSWARQKVYETKLLESVRADSCRDHHRLLTSQPHVAGTPGNFRVSQYIFDRFREYGLEAEFAEYEVLLAYPEEICVEIVAPERVVLANPEPADPLDPLTDVSRTPVAQLPWNAYSPDADFEAPVVYANHGRPEDFRQLEALGVSLQGKIALLRYFQGYRGGKSYEAEKHGVAGILVYSDPMEDGYFQGDVSPHGPSGLRPGLPWRKERRGGKARRRWNPRFLRPDGGRLLPRRRLARRPLGPARPPPARRQRLRLPRSRRPAHPRLALHPGSEAHPAGRVSHPAEDPHGAALGPRRRRSSAEAGRRRGAAGLAGSAAVHLPPGRRPPPGAPGEPPAAPRGPRSATLS